jgi:hypothetical protein
MPARQTTIHVEDPDITFPPQYRNYLIYVDESGVHATSKYYGWGTLWIPSEARGRLAGFVADIKERHRFEGEIKWSKVNARSEELACELIDEVLKRDWIMFHALLMYSRDIRAELFEGRLPEARLRHLSTLLRNKIQYFGGSNRRKTYHVRVDPLSSYVKEHEKQMKIANAMLKQTIGVPKITSMHTVDSKRRAGIQVVDLLLGAVLCPWNADVERNSPKARVSRHLLSRIGWPDHKAGTFADEWKFNLWWLSSIPEKRHAPGRRCNYHFPVRPYRRSRG